MVNKMSEDKRVKILDAAESIIKRRRFHEVKVDEISKEAGVGKGTIYRYFKSKDELFFKLGIEGFKALQFDVLEISGLEIDFNAKILKLSHVLYNFFSSRKFILRVMRDIEWRIGDLNQDWQNEAISYKAGIRDMIARVIEEGLELNLLAVDMTPIQYAEFWIHQLIGFSHWDENIDLVGIDKIVNLHLKKGGNNE